MGGSKRMSMEEKRKAILEYVLDCQSCCRCFGGCNDGIKYHSVASMVAKQLTFIILFSQFLVIVCSIYHKDQQVYTEKEITALAAKAGVNANSIEAVHNGLIDDGLVEKNKIGGSNFFWSFKAKKDRKAQIQHENTLKLIDELKPKVTASEADLATAKRGREDETDEEGATAGDGEEGKSSEGGGRAKKLARLSDLAKEKAALEAELEVLRENDPAALADL